MTIGIKWKVREKKEAGTELSTICRQLKLEASDGKHREIDEIFLILIQTGTHFFNKTALFF